MKTRVYIGGSKAAGLFIFIEELYKAITTLTDKYNVYRDVLRNTDKIYPIVNENIDIMLIATEEALTDECLRINPKADILIYLDIDEIVLGANLVFLLTRNISDVSELQHLSANINTYIEYYRNTIEPCRRKADIIVPSKCLSCDINGDKSAVKKETVMFIAQSIISSRENNH